MQVNLHNSSGNQFTSYGSDSVTINQIEYRNNILVSPTQITPLPISSIAELDDNYLTTLLEHHPDLIIFGSGQSIIHPQRELLLRLSQLQIGFEVMGIPALCRTFNYLIGEGRNVLAVLIF